MTIGFVGTDHTQAPLALRERLILDDGRLAALLDALRIAPGVAEAAVLATCNRVEVYVASADADIDVALAHALDSLLRVSGIRADEVAGLVARQTGAAAGGHLFAVAAGLESQVIGETQILTQVREAFQHAAARKAAGPELKALARMAVACGKRVRAHTALGRADASISALAVEQAAHRLGGLKGRSAVLIGAGRMNEISAGLLHERGIGSLVVVSRTRAAAVRLAAAYGGRDEAIEDLPALLTAANVAIAATRAPTPVVAEATILPRPVDRPLLLIDIAVPRDVDPAVGALPGVELVDMDGLRTATHDPVASGVADAQAIVDWCIEEYAAEARRRRAVPLIAALRARVDRQKEAEVTRALAGLEHLAPADRKAVELLAHRLVNRMFHHLATRLKAAATAPDADTYLQALSFLFDAADTGYRTVTAPAAEARNEPEDEAGAADLCG